jgi:ketosteroid isomerase-like protein
MIRVRMLVLTLVPGLVACTQVSREANTASERAAIEQVREREIRAFSQGNVDSLAAVFTENAVLMPPGEARVTGRPAIRSWAQNIANQFNIAGSYTGSEIVVVGEWAFERYSGRLTLTPKAGGTPIDDPLKGVHIYHRYSDGSWRISQDVWNSDPAPTTSAANATP